MLGSWHRYLLQHIVVIKYYSHQYTACNYRVTKLSKRAHFILRNMGVKNQSKENRNNDISKTPKEIS